MFSQFTILDLGQVSLGGGGEEEDDANNTKLKRGSFYMVAKELLKSSPVANITLTGHSVTSKGDVALGHHGYELCPEGEAFLYAVKEKEVKSFTSGNALKGMALNPKPLLPSFCWLWRGSFLPVHAKISIKKPFLAVDRDLRLEANRPVKINKED